MQTRLWRNLLLFGCLLGMGCFVLSGCALRGPSATKKLTPKQTFEMQERVLNSGRGADRRFYALRETAKLAVEAGEYGKAQQYATELLQMAPKYRKNWNYGNAIHDGHMVFGRVALAKGDKATAAKELLAAGKTPGSPQLNSFGPNMSLANDLLAKGDQKVVLAYFDECRTFWKGAGSMLDTWQREVQAGKTPDFGPNLHY